MTSRCRLLLPARGRRAALVAVLAFAFLALPLPRDGAKVLAADDACPEQNGTYQQACLLPPNVGENSFLSSPDDVDYFRIEVLDFGVTANVELTQAPRPYRLTVRDWEGAQVAAAEMLPNDDIKRTVQFKPKAPGSFYVLVDPLFDDADAVSRPSRTRSSTSRSIPARPRRSATRPTSASRPASSRAARSGAPTPPKTASTRLS